MDRTNEMVEVLENFIISKVKQMQSEGSEPEEISAIANLVKVVNQTPRTLDVFEKSSQVAGTTSEDKKKIDGITIQLDGSRVAETSFKELRSVEKTNQVSVGHIIGEVICILAKKGIITQEDLDEERAGTLKMLEELQNKKDEEVK